MSEIDSGRLRVFLGTLFALAVAFQTVSWMTGLRFEQLGVPYMFTPMLAAFAVVARSDRSTREFGARLGNTNWLAAALVVGVLIVGTTAVLSRTIPGVHVDATSLEAIGAPTGVLGLVAVLGATVALAVTVGAVTAFGEEFGWRGYLLWELAPLGFWRASLVVGAIWGVWHLPGIVQGAQYPSFPYVGVLVFSGATVALSPIYTYLVWRAKSVFAAVLLHGVFNAASMTVIELLSSENAVLEQLVATTIGGAGIVVCLVGWVVIAIRGAPTFDRERHNWAAEATQPGTSAPSDLSGR